MPIKKLRSDRGGEYNSQEFINYYEEHGIQKQLKAAYTPQQNGISERKNRTIMNMV
uniref:Retrovirus-related Pol polyprotein from transposon TNT 1-94 n=1 Tax=Cajanus cajan TaxID=3821 RepID=A0A151RDY0_CAJCA|nr:Retrovirus-related Pol polyprotein from transposon TNT 1-94 [Cajanus cajan]